MTKLKGKVALITGAATGIGEATARLFAQEGARVVIADWNAEGALDVANDLRRNGADASAYQADVSNPDDVQAMFVHTQQTYGRLDILMNNAGIGSDPKPLHETSLEDWERVIAVCLKGVFLGMKYALPMMIQGGSGNIINVASIAGIIGSPGLSPYAAAKAGVIELTKVGAAEYSRYNIRCNALAPGWTQTAMVDDYIGGEDTTRARMMKGVPLRRFGRVEEIAAAALFLAGDEAQFMQGHTLVIDGGTTII